MAASLAENKDAKSKNCPTASLRNHRDCQLWVADMTFIHLSEHFAYPTIILDAFSRRIVGWVMVALEMAITDRRIGKK